MSGHETDVQPGLFEPFEPIPQPGALLDYTPASDTHRERIAALIRARGTRGLTDEEGVFLLGIRMQSYTPRRGELVALGRVVDSGHQRKTSSGCAATVWVGTEWLPAVQRERGS